MRRVILANDQTLRVVRVPGEAGVFSFLDDLSANDARRYLEEYAGDSMAMAQLRMALAEDSLGMPVAYLDDADVLDEVAWRISMNQLTIAEEIPRPLPKVPEPAEASSRAAAPPPELPRSKKLTWIEFKVVWEDTGSAVANVRLVVKDPNGEEKYSDTDSQGKIRFEEIEQGAYDLHCDLKGATMEDTIDFVGMGKPSAQDAPANGSRKSRATSRRIAEVEEHPVKTGESIDSLAKGAGMTWKELAKFNWGTDVPDQINIHLREVVGCRKKTKDGKNYVFDTEDKPGIVLIPRKWTKTGLSTGETHIIRVMPLAKGVRVVIPVQSDLDGDPQVEDKLRLQSDDGSFSKVLASSDKAVRPEKEKGLLFFDFGNVPDGKYAVAYQAGDEWCTILKGLEVAGNKLMYGGKRFDVDPKDIGLEEMPPQDSPNGPVEEDSDDAPEVEFMDDAYFENDEVRQNPGTPAPPAEPEGEPPEDELELVEEEDLVGSD